MLNAGAKTNLNFLLSFFILLLLSSLSRGAIVRGFVWEKGTKEPLIGCNVYLEGTGFGSATNKEGYYVISGVKEGTYKIVFSYVGYKEISKILSFLKDTLITLNVELEREIIKLPEIKISAQRSEFKEEVKGSAIKITPPEFKSFPHFLEADIIRSLQSLPGVITANDFSAALYVRGGAADQNLILLDGVNVYNPFHIGGLFSVFDLSALKSALFLTGGFPAEYGGRLSSVLDIDVKEGNKERYQGELGLSLLASKFLTEGPIPMLKKKNSSFLFSFRRTYFDKLLPLFKINFPYYFYDGHLKTNVEISPKTKIFFSGFFNFDVFDYGFHKTRIYFDWGNRTGSIFFRHLFTPQLFTKTYLTFSRYFYNIDIAEGLIWVKDWVNELSLKGEGIYYLRPNNELKFGLEGRMNQFTYDANIQGFSFDIKGKPEYFSLYLANKWKLNKFLLQPGLRMDNSFVSYKGQVSYYQLNPVIGIKYFLKEDLAGKVSLGRYSQFITALLPEFQPVPFLYVWVPTFGPYEPQIAYHFILGLEKFLGEEIFSSIEWYYKSYERLYEMNERADPLLIEETILKEGKGKSFGFDFLFRKDLGNLTGWFSYSFSWVKVKFGNKSYFPFYDRRHNLNLLGGYSFPRGFRLSGRVAFYSGNPYTQPIGRYRYWYWRYRYEKWHFFWSEIPGEKNNARYPPYLRIDLGLEKEWKVKNTNLITRLEIINLLNRKNLLFYYYDYEKDPPVKKGFYMLPIFPSLSFEWHF